MTPYAAIWQGFVQATCSAHAADRLSRPDRQDDGSPSTTAITWAMYDLPLGRSTRDPVVIWRCCHVSRPALQPMPRHKIRVIIGDRQRPPGVAYSNPPPERGVVYILMQTRFAARWRYTRRAPPRCHPISMLSAVLCRLMPAVTQQHTLSSSHGLHSKFESSAPSPPKPRILFKCAANVLGT